MAMPLLDQWGQPIKVSALTKTIAGPDMVGMRPAVVTTPILGLDPMVLGEAMAAADAGDSLAWQTVAEVIEERDAHYQGVLGTRKRTVAQLPITVEPASDDPNHKKHAEFIESWLRDQLVENMLFDMLDAVGKGWSVHELIWKLTPGDNRIVEAIYNPQRWFDVSYQDGDSIMVRDVNAAPAPPSVPGAPTQAGFVAMPPLKFAVHKHPSWSGLALRSGLTRTVAWHSMFKAFASRDWGVFVQAYGLPLRIGKYGPGASENDRAVLARAVFDLAGAAGAIIPESMLIEMHEPKNGAGSNDIHQRRCDWLDSQTSKVVLGQTGTTDSKAGAHASSAIHRLVQEDIERWDAAKTSWTVNVQMVRPQIDLTFGPQKGGYPKVSIGRPDETPVAEVTQALQWMGPQGLTVRASEVRQRLNFTDPDPDDEVIGGRAPPPPVEPPHDLPARQQPAADRPGEAPGATVHDEPAPGRQAPAAQAEQDTTKHHAILGRVLTRHTAANGPTIVQALSDRTTLDASAAMGKMIAPAREAFEAADSVPDLEARLAKLNLPSDQLAEVMANAMIVAELAGEATVLDELAARHG